MERGIQILPGVNLTLVQTDQFKTGCFSVNLVRPLCREEAALNALLPNVLLRGTRDEPTMQAISAHLDDLYGASAGSLVRIKGEVQTLGFYADFLSEHLVDDGEQILAPVIDFMGRVLLDPCLENGELREDYVQSEKNNLINAIEANINEKRAYAQKRLLSTMCADEAYGLSRIGEVAEVRAITPERLTEHWKKVLATSRVELFYLGRESAETVVPLFRKALAELPREELVHSGTNVIRTAAEPKELIEQMPVTQGKLSMGFRTGCTCADADYPALVLLNAVFGSGVTSKLFINVREKQSLCYYANSALEKFKGLMIVSSGIESDKFEVARDEILRQLDACRAGEISDEELESARRHLDSLLRMQMDAPGSLDDFYIGQAISGLNGSIQALREALLQVTREQVVQAAQKISLDTVYFLKGVQA